jgi:lysozyme family protein
MQGITLRKFREWRNNQSLDRHSLRNITEDEVKLIYRVEYWNTIHADELPYGVDHIVFDMGVNAGVRRSGMMLQRAANMGPREVDGVVGPRTLAAVSKHAPKALIEALAQFHENHYRALKHFDTFGAGWMARLGRRRALAHELASEA